MRRTLSPLSRRKKVNPQTQKAIDQAYAQTEILLLSIPSILIGVNQGGVVTHWNSAAEHTFGISASRVLHRPFTECGVHWNPVKVLEGIRRCSEKGTSVRVDDVPFRRLNGQDGFLGMTILPLRQGNRGPEQCILFGADITERKKTEELKNEFVNTVSHELRTPLTIIKEGVAQVMEGLLGTLNEQQRHSLALTLEGIEHLNRLVDDLLDMAKIEAGRLVLKWERVDIVGLVRGMSIAFAYQVKEKGLEIKTRLPNEKIELYVDRDKMVQVFTNLISNALKFTEQGSIEMAVEDRGETVECRVSDTGKGIAREDLPKAFGKFQQFGRTDGSKIKGTGLGLAICKGIVELHHGEIRVESKFGQGTSLIFTLPKSTARELFKESIGRSIKEAIKGEASLSLLVFDMENLPAAAKIGEESLAALTRSLEALVRKHLPRKAEVVAQNSRDLLALLPGVEKEEALVLAGRIQQSMDDDLVQQGLADQIKLACRVVAFPWDGNTEEELLAKI